VRRVELTLEGFEMAAGADGFLRGAPEPCLLVGVFHVSQGRATTIGRSLTRLPAPSAFPERLEVKQELVRSTVHLAAESAPPGTFVMLAIALEEDSGRDVQSLYADLDYPERFAIWEDHTDVPEPRAIDELGAMTPSSPPVAESVRVMRRDRDLASDLPADDFVGSLLIRVDESPASRATQWRFRFRSSDGRNDWTAVLLARIA